MNDDKLLKNAELANADISMFHAPDRKWKNYYYEDEEQDLLFLLPSYLFYGPIVVDLDWARTASFETKDGVIHAFRDYAWGMSSPGHGPGYPKTTVTDRSAKCGRRTILLGSLVSSRVSQEDDPEREGRFAADHVNGRRLDNRRVNVRWGAVKENNDDRRPRAGTIPEIEYPFEVWWR